MDEKDDQKIKDDQKVEEPTTAPEPEEKEETPAPSQETEEAPQEQTEEEPEAEAPEETEEKPKSRRENLRIQQLVEKLRDQSSDTPQGESGLDYKKELDADDDVYNKLETDRKSYGDNKYSEGLRTAETVEWRVGLKVDDPKVKSQYPVFDPDSPNFNAAVSDGINKWYLKTSGYDPKTNTVKNPSIGYADFVESIMELSDELAGEKVSESQKNIAKQAASTGVRPTGASKKLDLTKHPEDMTKEELNAAIKASTR